MKVVVKNMQTPPNNKQTEPRGEIANLLRIAKRCEAVSVHIGIVVACLCA
jgi:hypothetical protein